MHFILIICKSLERRLHAILLSPDVQFAWLDARHGCLSRTWSANSKFKILMSHCINRCLSTLTSGISTMIGTDTLRPLYASTPVYKTQYPSCLNAHGSVFILRPNDSGVN